MLESTLQRPAPQGYERRSPGPLRRRLVAAALVVASLVLVTVYFREARGGTLHDVQSAGASVLRPFEVAANRVAQPFRDLAGWVDGMTSAQAERDRLRAEVERLRRQLVQSQAALGENAYLRRLLQYRDGPAFPRDYRGRTVAAAVVSRAPSQFEQQIVIAAGSADGVRVHDPVVTEDGLVGQVTKTAARQAQVTLLTDESMAVSALDVQTNAAGILRHGAAASDVLTFDRVPKQLVVNPGDPVMTSGWRSGALASLYPRGIPIGVVTSVGQVDTDLYKQVQVEPFADLASLSAVIVLTGGG